jgi:amidophosphoribosyltransferase
MAKFGDFVAFRAALALLKATNQLHIIEEVYQKSLTQVALEDNEVVNYVKEIYAPFTNEQISDKIAELVAPENLRAKLKVIFQTVENLHIACPENLGDWYFTGDYPTPGGNRVVNQAFINFYEGSNERAY